MDGIISYIATNFYLYIEVIIKVVLCVILGGLIGMERESINRPAGLRTHILVCVGAALTMMISEYMFKAYQGIADVDPSRIGAQVISGIGFLGAGTIIKDGVTVKGLTTAASLWAVSCIGLAIGTGFYSGAIISTAIVYTVLVTLPTLKGPIFKKGKKFISVKIEITKNKSVLGDVERILEEKKIGIRGIKYLKEMEETSIIKLFLIFEDIKQYDEIISILCDIDGVKRMAEY